MDTEELLRFLYLFPVGVAEIDQSGAIRMLNALGSQLLMPSAPGGRMENLFDLLAPFDTGLKEQVSAHAEDAGQVCAGHRASFSRGGSRIHLDFTVIRLDPARLMVAFSDVTRLVEAEEAARTALEAQARQAGKIEVASGVLHDIGNAITGLGARSARLNADTGRAEIVQLERLGAFVDQHEAGLDAALGAGKSAALRRFVRDLCAALRARFDDWDDSARLFARTVAHVQEILNIQREHAGFGSAHLGKVALAHVLDDVLSIQSGALARRGIVARRSLPEGLPALRADRTKLVQVLLNIVKNACEAFDDPLAPASDRRLSIQATPSDGGVTIDIVDNGGGFDVAILEELMRPGVSRKPGGSGLGLAGAAGLIELQGGTFEISSPGPGLGAAVRIMLPSPKEPSP